APVVRRFPFGGFGIEKHLESKFRETCFDITWRGGTIARKYISPVALTIDEQIFLPKLHESISDGSIAVGMILHGSPNDIGHFVVSAVIHAFHGVQDAA